MDGASAEAGQMVERQWKLQRLIGAATPACGALALALCVAWVIMDRQWKGPTVDDYPNRHFENHAARARLWRLGLEGPSLAETCGSVSGCGSSPRNTQPLQEFLAGWLREKNITSFVEAASGHWPSGWQRHVRWPELDYTGVDIVPEIITQNRQMVLQDGASSFGLRSMTFTALDMLTERLPAADVLFTKDTLPHFPNVAVMQFLNLSITVCPPLFRYVLLVSSVVNPAEFNTTDGHGSAHEDVAFYDGFRQLNLAMQPFGLPVTQLFAWTAQGAYIKGKVVQLFEPRCPGMSEPRRSG